MWRGRHVETPHGWGICTAEGETLEVLLDSREQCHVRPCEVLRSSFGALGSCLQTSEGPGVLMRYRREDGLHEVQLCPSRTRSLLKASELLEVLVALPGLQVVTSRGPGVCQLAEASRVSVAFEDGSEDWLPAADVQCPVARTMPVVSGFLDAASSMMRLHAGTLERLTKAFEGVGLERLQEQLLSSASEASSSALRLWDEWEAKENKEVVEAIQGHAQEVLPKLEGLLDGLSKMSRESFDGVWQGKADQEARCSIEDGVLRWHWGEDSDLEIWSETMVSTLLGGEIFRGTLRRSEHWCLSGRARGEDGCLEWSDGDVWQRQEPLARELHQNVVSLQELISSGEFSEVRGLEDAMSCLSKIAQTASGDEDVKRLASNLELEMRSWLEPLEGLQQQLSESKAGSVLLSGHERLTERLSELQDGSLAPQIASRGQRFLTRLATDRKVKKKASELYSVVEQRFSMLPSQLEDWVAKLRLQLLERLGLNRALLVDGLRSLPLTQEDLRELLVASWDHTAKLEAQLESSLLTAMASGLDCSGTELLDCFESSASFGSIPVVRESSESLVTLLKELGIQVPAAVQQLLEAQAEGRMEDVETWRQALKSSLEDDVVVKGCESLVEQGELVLQKLQELKGSQAMSRAVEQLESEDIERQVLSHIQDFNAAEALSTAEDAWSNLEARESLVNRLKDTCLDLVLKILPSIQIEKVSGRDNDCDWEISNINFSDVSFRKEDVRVQLNELEADILRISAWNISAHFDRLKVQVSSALGKSECVADAKAESMSVKLAFRLHCDGKTPELVVSSRSIQMEKLNLWVHESEWSVSAIMNALSYLFADRLKTYACGKIASKLDEHMDVVIQSLNQCLMSCSPVLHRLGFQQLLPQKADLPAVILDRHAPEEPPQDYEEPDTYNILSALG